MNKILNINLGGHPFVIDVEAYNKLEDYLATIEMHFSESEGFEEITSDIEDRLGELFQEALGKREIITPADVQDAIAIMGSPEQFGAEAGYEEDEPRRATSSGSGTYRTGRKLFRDIDNQKVAGVASGVAEYFGIEDVVWVRLGFVLTTIFAGFGLPLYIVLWCITPEALTSADRLAMRGEKIDVNNMAKIIEDEITNVTDSFGDFGSGKKNVAANGENEWSDEADGFRSPIEKGVSLVAKIFTGVIRIAKVIFMPVLYLIGGLLFFSLLASWFGLTAAGVFVLPHVDFFTHGPDAVGYVALFNAIFAIGIPLLVIVLSITKYIFRFKVNKSVTISLIVFAVINVFSFISIAGSAAKDFNVETTQISQFNSDRAETDTIHLSFPKKNDREQNFVVHLGDVMKIADDKLFVRAVDVKIKKSTDDKFSINLKKTGRGNNSVASEDYLDHISLDIKEDNGRISIPEFYAIEKGGKFRAQDIDVTINVPEGKHIVFGKGVKSSMVSSKTMADGYQRNFRKEGLVWKMTKNGLSSNLSAEESNKKDNKLSFSISTRNGIEINLDDNIDESSEDRSELYAEFEGYDKLKVNGNFIIHLERSDVFQIRTDSENSGKVDFSQSNETLTVSQVENESEAVPIYIKLPKLESVDFTDIFEARLNGFEQENMTIKLIGEDAGVHANIDVEHLGIEMIGSDSDFTIDGQGKILKANLNGLSSLNAAKFSVEQVILQGEVAKKVIVNASDKVNDKIRNSEFVRNNF